MTISKANPRVLRVMAVLALVAVSLAAAAARSDRNTPPFLQRERAPDCVGSYNTKDGASRLLINNCERLVYVSVLERDAMTVRPRCAVFGLQGRRYGKAYGPGESYMTYSLSVWFDADQALNACERHGYEIQGGGIGRFIRVTNFQEEDQEEDQEEE